MFGRVILMIFYVGLLMAGVVLAASVEQAKTHLQNGELERAKQELVQVLGSSAADDQMAAALDLLATIAVEEQDYATAAERWASLVTDYPDGAAALGAATKLQLVEALLERESPEVAEPAPSAPPAAAVPAPAEESPTPTAEAPESAPPARGRAEDRMAAAPASAPQKVRVEEPVVPRVPGLVLVAAAGKPYDAAQYAGEKLTAFLEESGVNAESPTGGIPVVEDSAGLLARMLKAVEDRGAESLAFMRVNFQSWQRITVEVYAADGSLLWKDMVRGGTGYTGRPYSKTGANEKLLQRFFDKLTERVGGPGLPVTR